MIGGAVARGSAILLAAGGAALLFASDTILPALLPSLPPGGAWLGQMLAAAWLGVAALTWNGRRAMLGGIYGRPVVATNATLFLVSALSLLRALVAGEAPTVLWFGAVPCALFAALYFWLMLRGPFARDLHSASAASPGTPPDRSRAV
ncbi:MAG: hypothetical protein ABI910_00685 [Gemmatimonadota bacterium]